MENLTLIVLVAVVLVSFGVLIGCTLSARALDARERRQAAVQRSLNEQWQALEAAKKTIVR